MRDDGTQGMEVVYEPGVRAALRHQIPWTMREIKRAREMADQGHGNDRIAVELGRTVKSVKGMLARLRKNGAHIQPRRVPLHGVDLSRAHPVIRKIFTIAAREGYTHQVLADKAGVSRCSIGNLAHRNCSFGNVVAIAEAAGLRLVAVRADETDEAE